MDEKRLEKLRQGNLTIMGNNGVKHLLKKLKPIEESVYKDKTYLLKTDVPLKMGCDHNYIFYLHPDTGPILKSGETIPILFESENEKLIEDYMIKSITYADNMGYIITFE